MSHQAIRHAGTEPEHYRWPVVCRWRSIRLTGFEAGLKASGFELRIATVDPGNLDEASVLIVAGRIDHLKFCDEELESIESFHKRGRGLFLMANHPGFVAPQNQITDRLALPIKFNEKDPNGLSPKFVDLDSHPTSSGCSEGLRFRTSCTMTLLGGQCVAVVVDEDKDIGVIAAEIENTESGYGRVFATTSAGHIASDDDDHMDLYGSASNARWTLNIVKWLS